MGGRPDEPNASAGAPADGLGGSGGDETGAGGEANVESSGGGGERSETPPLPRVIDASPTGHDRFYATAFDARGNVFALGQITSSNDANADAAILIAKFSPDGELDRSFGAGGYYVRNVQSGTTGELFRSLVLQSTGKLVALGVVEHPNGTDARDRDIALIRVNPDGTKDASFGNDGVVRLDLSTGVANGNSFLADSAWGLSVYADDRLVLSGGKLRDGGLDTNFVIVRLSPDGVPDPSFGTQGVFELDTALEGVEHNQASARGLTLLPDGDGIVGAGYQPLPGGGTAPVVYKLTDAGALDASFGDAGVFHTPVLRTQTECYEAAVQPMVNGGYKLVTTGYGRDLENETSDFVSLRLGADGALDPTYGDAGVVRLDIAGFGDNSRKLVVLPDRRILLVGGGRLTSSNVDGVLALLGADGAPDMSFGARGFRAFDLGGPADFFWSAALSPDRQRLAVVGIQGVGNAPMPAAAADSSVLFLLPTP